MTERVLKIGWRRLVSLGRDESGAALVITLGVFFFLFILVSAVYAIGQATSNRIQLQQTADAAAYSAAVAQADGLSRMATINRAMSWTYVQLVRRQMDYITYRWLKLTYKNFKEDRDAAEDWHFSLMACDKHHDQEGPGWWCGQGKDNRDKIRLNMRGDYIDYKDLKDVLDDMQDVMKDDAGGDSGPAGEHQDIAVDFGLQNLTPIQQKMVEIYQQYSSTKTLDEIFTMWYVACGGPPEPEKYVTDKHGALQINPEWAMWNQGRKAFVDKNEITSASYGDLSQLTCPVCGKPFIDPATSKIVDHSNCRKKDDTADSGGECPVCHAPKRGGTHKYCGWGQGLAQEIQEDKRALEMMNQALSVVNLQMIAGMNAAARQVLERNLPRTADGQISPDFVYAIHLPISGDPYAGVTAEGMPPSGIYSPLFNTEEHETLFLNMADGEAPGRLARYFNGTSASGFLSSLLTGKDKGQGLDQWFIRTSPAETMIDSQVAVMPTTESFHAPGISRSYKNANRDEGKSWLLGTHRGNHVLQLAETSFGSGDLLGLSTLVQGIFNCFMDMADISPSCQNSRDRFPDMCAKIDDSVALVSQYRWASAKWFCFFTVYTFGIEWHHPFLPKFYCSDHGYGDFLGWIPEEVGMLAGFDGKSREDYRCCFMGIDPDFVVKGYARIYGDDRDLVNEQYVGVPAKPWLLNERYFAGDGTVTVGLARRQRNPWQSFMRWFFEFDAESPNVSRGLMSFFNVKPENYQWTASTARAAYRRRSDGWRRGEAAYQVAFDVSAWPDALEVKYAPKASGELKRLRVGCVCGDGENRQRLEKAWNLCTPDWEATLLPVRYAHGHVAKTESWKDSGPGTWQESQAAQSGVFDTLAGQAWKRLDGSGTEVGGASVMRSLDIDGRELGGGGSLGEIERQKVY